MDKIQLYTGKVFRNGKNEVVTMNMEVLAESGEFIKIRDIEPNLSGSDGRFDFIFRQ